MKLAKSRITDFRPPPRAGAFSPVERRRGATTGGSVAAMTGLDHLDAIARREAMEHDRAVAGYSRDLLADVWDDLCRRPAYDRKNPEHRWILARKAAVGRAAMRMERGLA